MRDVRLEEGERFGGRGPNVKEKRREPSPPPPPARCPSCREEKPWLRPGEICATCRTPQARTVRVLEEEAPPAPMVMRQQPLLARRAAPVVEKEAEVVKEKVMPKKHAWQEGLSAEQLRAWRTGQGLSKGEAAKLLNVSGPALSAWESGKYSPSDEAQARMRALFADRDLKPANVTDRDLKPANVTPDVAPGSHDPRTEPDAPAPKAEIVHEKPRPSVRQVALAGLAMFGRALAAWAEEKVR